jgi:ribosome biogenesis SPOUT family RNA methylase Rps3
MEKSPQNNPKWFISEHMEDWLFEWSTCEYIQAATYMSKRGNYLLISNFDQILLNQSEENKINLNTLLTTLIERKLESYIFFMKKPIKTALKTNTFELSELYSPDKESASKLSKSDLTYSTELKKVSLLDLRAKKSLCCDDKKELNVLIFGGILGDHPPRDRTKPLREFLGDNMRHLGPIQMSTDTAIFTSQIILSDNLELEEIPFVDAPEVISPEDPDHAIDLEGFRYISKQFDLDLGVISEEKNKEVHMHPKIRNELLFEEFDFGNMDLI